MNHATHNASTPKFRFRSPRFLLAVALLAATGVAGWSRLGEAARPPVQGATGHGDVDVDGSIVVPVQLNEWIDVAIHVEGADSLAAWEATVQFDPGVVIPVDARLGGFAPSGSTALRGGVPADGRFAVGGYNTTARTSTGAGDLTIVSFIGVSNGQANITLDPATAAAFDAIGQPLDATLSLRLSGGPIYLPRLANGGE